MDHPNLEGKRVLVTGASGGIGRAIAIAAGRHGANVAIAARRTERLEDVAGEIRREGGSALVLPADFLSEDEIIATVARAAAEWEGLDILVNSAGVARQSNLMDGDSADWSEMWQINVFALATASREALRFFPDSGGQILNLSSMSGHRVPGRGGFYAATKFAVRAMTEGLRQELRHAGNLTRVGSLSPGFVDTELLDDYFASGDSPLKKEEAIRFPIIQPAEVAHIALQQLTMPPNVDMTDVLFRPTGQAT